MAGILGTQQCVKLTRWTPAFGGDSMRPREPQGISFRHVLGSW